MADAMRIEGPVQVASSTRESVALQLMDIIAARETENQESRDYWLKLYHQCLLATEGNSVEKILKRY